jgi:CHAT domain-containing protein/tetratricopeptide (TPR) repeat protein
LFFEPPYNSARMPAMHRARRIGKAPGSGLIAPALWLLVLLPVLFPGGVQAQNPLTVLVPGGAVVTLEAPPQGSIDVAVRVPATDAAVITFRETRNSSSIVWTDANGKAHTARTNLAGQDAVIRFTLIGSDLGLQKFAVSARNRKQGSTLQASVTALRAAGPRDAEAVSAEEALATGEFLWGKHDPGKSAEAEAAFDRAITGFRNLGEIPMLRAGLTWKGIYLTFSADAAQPALKVLSEATSLPGAGDRTEQANAWKTLGFADADLADYAAAWNDYARALELFQLIGDRFNEEVLFENRGTLSRLTGDDEGALNDEEAAERLAGELGDEVGVLHIEEAIGAIRLQRGELQKALEQYQQVLALETISPGDFMIGFAETDMAHVYREMAAIAEARDMLARAMAFWAAHPYLLGRINTLVEQGSLETRTGELRQAAESYREAQDLAASANLRREMVFAAIGLGDVEQRRGELRDASRDYARAFELASAIDEFDSLARIRISEGDVALREGNSAAAESRYEEGYRIALRSYDHADTIRALGGLARAEHRAGRNLDARRHIELALIGIESTRDRIESGSLQTGYFSTWHSYYDLAVRVLMGLSAQHPHSGYAREALNTAESARARFLLEQIERGGSKPRSGDPALGRARARTLRRLHLAEATLVALRAHNGNAERADRLTAEVAELKEQDDRIEAAIFRGEAARHSVEVAASGREFSDLVRQLQMGMGPKAALLEYWTDPKEGFGWVVTAKDVRSYSIPGNRVLRGVTEKMTADLQAPFVHNDGSVDQFAAALAGWGAQFDSDALRLAKMILPAHTIPHSIRNLLVVGDGPLLSVPFAALPDPAAPANDVYLQKNYCIVGEPSIAVLVALMQEPHPAQPMKIALFADPVLGAADPRLNASSARVAKASLRRGMTAPARTEPPAWISVPGEGNLRRLAYAGAEARDIASLAGAGHADLRVGFDASLENVRSLDWSEYTVAHFATHAVLNGRDPDLAGIAFSRFDAAGHPQPGFLWFSDIVSMRMPVRLVVLSACDSAAGDDVPGEGLVGLSYAFFLAGAHRVASSLWSVDDEATKVLMGDFYTALLIRGESPAEALRTAQRKLAATARWSNPYYWAGFTIEGDSRALPH